MDEVALPLLPFMSAYVARLKSLQKRCVARRAAARLRRAPPRAHGAAISIPTARSRDDSAQRSPIVPLRGRARECHPRNVRARVRCRRRNAGLAAAALAHVQAILEGVAGCGRYPSESALTPYLGPLLAGPGGRAGAPGAALLAGGRASVTGRGTLGPAAKEEQSEVRRRSVSVGRAWPWPWAQKDVGASSAGGAAGGEGAGWGAHDRVVEAHGGAVRGETLGGWGVGGAMGTDGSWSQQRRRGGRR